MENLEHAQEYILSNEISKKDKQKQNGEVFTPYEIIIKMLNELENAYERKNNSCIYANPNLKWFDNSSGIGNFMIVIYCKLYIGLKDIIKNSKKRKKHILENMLYMSELEQTNIDKCVEYFNSGEKCKNISMNINCGDSLELDVEKTWKFKEFDIIIGNPPYQKQNKKNNTARGGTNNNLYIEFIRKSISQIKQDGYLVYIHPENYRKINNNILNDMLAYRFEFIGLGYGGKLFKGVSTKTDFYVWKKTPNDDKFLSVVECYDKKNSLIVRNIFHINLNNNIDFIPRYYSSEIQSILHKITSVGYNKTCVVNSFCHKIREHVVKHADKTNEHIYPLYNTSGNPYEYFSSKKHYDQDKKKVILSCSGRLSPIYDDGKFGTTQDSMYIIVQSDFEGQQLIKILNTKLYQLIINICKWGNFRNEQKLFSTIKYPPISNTDITDEYVNIFFNLNNKEIDVLNKKLIL